MTSIQEEAYCDDTLVVDDLVNEDSTDGYINITDGVLAVWSGLGYEDYQFKKQLTSPKQAFNIIKLLVE